MSAWGCTYNFPSVNLPSPFLCPGGARAASAPPGYAYGRETIFRTFMTHLLNVKLGAVAAHFVQFVSMPS